MAKLIIGRSSEPAEPQVRFWLVETGGGRIELQAKGDDGRVQSLLAILPEGTVYCYSLSETTDVATFFGSTRPFDDLRRAL